MPRIFNPSGVHTPVGAYSHVAEVAAGAKLYFIAGQVGVNLDGDLADGVEAQAEQVYRNIEAILGDLGLGFDDVVKTTTYMVDAEDGPVRTAAQKKVMGDIKPPNTLVYISALAQPNIKIEIEAIAVKD